MKKTIAFILVLVLCIGLCACSSPAPTETVNTNPTTNDVTTSYDDSYQDDLHQEDYLTKDEAEQAALRSMKIYVNLYYGQLYNSSATRYSVSTITGSSSNGYTVYGKFYLYDYYGDLCKSKKFSIFVRSDGYAVFDGISVS